MKDILCPVACLGCGLPWPSRCLAHRKVAEVRERIAGGIAEIDHRPQFRALHLPVVIDGVYPQVKHNIHLRAFAHADQLMDGGNREKEKAHILQTWVIVVERRIVLLPAVDREFNQVVSAKLGVGDVILLLQEVENG